MLDLLLMDLYALSLKAKIAAFLINAVIIIILVFAVIGVIATVKWFLKRKKPKETPGEKWRRTGRID